MPAEALPATLRLVFFTVLLDLVGFGMVVPLLPLYASKLGASPQQISYLFASFSLMQFIFAPIWGRLSDFVGRRPVLLTSIAGNVVAMLLYAWAPNFGWLLIGRLFAGICAANIAVAQAVVADVTTASNVHRGMGMVGAAFGLGFVLGPFLGGELSRFGSSAPALAAAALGVCNGLWALWALPETHVDRSSPARWWRTFLPTVYGDRFNMLRGGVVPTVVLLLIFVQVLGFAMMEMALVLFTKVRLGFGPVACGRVFGFLGIMLVLMQGGLSFRLIKRFGEAWAIGLGMSMVAVALLLLPSTPPGWLSYFLLCLSVMALGQGLLNPALNARLSHYAQANNRGAVLGLGQSLSSLARVLGPSMGGLAIQYGSINDPFWLGGVLVGLAAILAWGWL